MLSTLKTLGACALLFYLFTNPPVFLAGLAIPLTLIALVWMAVQVQRIF